MGNKENEEKPKLTKEQREKMKKYAVFSLMCAICAGALWFIFAPSSDRKAKLKAQSGFNTDIPMPKDAGMTDDKREAYEKDQVREKQADRMRSLSDFSQLLDGDNKTIQKDDLSPLKDEAASPSARSKAGAAAPRQTPVQKSVNAYRDVNRSVGNFYEAPKIDLEKEDLKRQVEVLKSQMPKSEKNSSDIDNQMAIMEKSYQLAARYMPGAMGTGTGTLPNDTSAQAGKTANAKSTATGKMPVVPVTNVRERTITCLTPVMSNAEFLDTYGKERNLGFLTAAGEINAEDIRNTISAIIEDNQTVMDGDNVRLRLLEPVQAGKVTIPPLTLLSGIAKIQGERLFINIYSIESTGRILPVSLSAYDLDGQAGIFIPDTKEINAVKEIAANMGTNSGTSINLSRSAGSQILSDLGRNAIQGVSQFFSKKMREVKVSLKAGYKVFLVAPSNSPKGGE